MFLSTVTRPGRRRVILLSNGLKALFSNSWLELAARWILGITFIYSCYHKVIAPAYFAKIIYGYYLFPDWSINLIAIILPFLELFAGLALVLGIYPRSAALIVNALLLMFIIALSINLIRGQEFDCGCFSPYNPDANLPPLNLLFRDIIMFAASVFIFIFNFRQQSGTSELE